MTPRPFPWAPCWVRLLADLLHAKGYVVLRADAMSHVVRTRRDVVERRIHRGDFDDAVKKRADRIAYWRRTRP